MASGGVVLSCPQGHNLFKWKKLKTWDQLRGALVNEQHHCGLCKTSIGNKDYRLRCDQGCDYEVCVSCVNKAGGAICAPEGFHAAVAKAAKDWGSTVKMHSNKTSHEPKDTHFKEYEKLLSDAGASYYNTPIVFKPNDVLLIVDMQNDFLPAEDAPLGGRFGVTEGGGASDVIVELIKKAVNANVRIVATRDYHPKNHCSFIDNGGHFPAHCVQGGKGSYFFEPVERALLEAREKNPELVSVVFKGFHPGVDSFGGFTYPTEYFKARSLGDPEEVCHGCCMIDWTGCFSLTCSSIDEDLNAPPDVLAVMERKTIKETLGPVGRLFGVGLAFDFCVLDSLINASEGSVASEGCFLVADAARAAYIPGVGTFGTGYLSDPEDVVHKLVDHNIKLMKSTVITSPCVKGCGRPAFASYLTCCTKCTGPDGEHAADCLAKSQGVFNPGPRTDGCDKRLSQFIAS